jgi:hypothetical protein
VSASKGDDGVAGGEIHDASDDERHGFGGAEAKGPASAARWRRQRERPRLREFRDVAGVDFGQRREPGSREVVVVRAPLLRGSRCGALRTAGCGEPEDEKRGVRAGHRVHYFNPARIFAYKRS